MNGSTRAEAWIAILLVVVLLGLGSTLTKLENPAPDLRASSFVRQRHGIKALYQVLEEVGIAVERKQTPLTVDDPTDCTVIMAGPSEPVLDREVSEIMDWVDKGGRLVVVADRSLPGVHSTYHKKLLEAVGVSADRAKVNAASVKQTGLGVRPSYKKLDWPARQVLSAATDGPTDDRASTTVVELVTSSSGSLAVKVAVGEMGGEAVVIADVTLLNFAVLAFTVDQVIIPMTFDYFMTDVHLTPPRTDTFFKRP